MTFEELGFDCSRPIDERCQCRQLRPDSGTLKNGSSLLLPLSSDDPGVELYLDCGCYFPTRYCCKVYDHLFKDQEVISSLEMMF